MQGSHGSHKRKHIYRLKIPWQENQLSAGNWWEDRWLNRRQKEKKNIRHHGSSPGDRCSNQHLWAHSFTQIHFKPAVLQQSDTRSHLSTLTSSSEFNLSEKGGQTALTSFSLSYFFLTSLIRLSSDGERSIQPPLLLPPAPPFTPHQTARVMEDFGGHTDLCEQLGCLYDQTPVRLLHTTVSTSQGHTHTHTYSTYVHTHTLLFFNPFLQIQNRHVSSICFHFDS